MNTKSIFLRLLPGFLILWGSLLTACGEPGVTGYRDTPVLPGTPWRVHDGDRPAPPVVTPPEHFSLGAPPPEGAVVLFDGSGLERWSNARGEEAGWKVEDGHMEIAPRSGNIRTRDRFTDFQLHLEFASPAEVRGRGQQRGNSGVFFHGLYEVQILDSYDNPTYPDGQAAALYGQQPPLFNAGKPPGEWQTYDIVYEAPRWDGDGNLVKRAKVTVFHNGVLVHNRQAFLGRTRHRAVAEYDRVHEPEGFIELQDHGDPVRFRNIWLLPLPEKD